MCIRDSVLAGGGNTSVKDDTTLYVKGSGTQLATIKSEEFVEMSRARLNEIMKTDYPEDDVKRDVYKRQVIPCVAMEMPRTLSLSYWRDERNSFTASVTCL